MEDEDKPSLRASGSAVEFCILASIGAAAVATSQRHDNLEALRRRIEYSLLLRFSRISRLRLVKWLNIMCYHAYAFTF